MNYNEFIMEVKTVIQKQMQEEYEVTIQTVTKNNDVVLSGLCILEKDENICPTIYLHEYFAMFQGGSSIEEIADMIIRQYEHFKVEEDINMDFFTDFSRVKDKIVYRLVNLERNKERLKEMPYFTYLDFAIVFYCHLTADAKCHASVPIGTSHMKMWNTTKAELLTLAKKNTPKLFPCQLISMQSMIHELMGDDEGDQYRGIYEKDLDAYGNTCHTKKREKEFVPMYILTNTAKFNGASVILYDDTLKDFATACKGSFFLLPSSVHEVILIPAVGNTSMNELTQMVREVNATQVEREELLSDHAYYYDSKKHMLLH